MNLFYNIKGQGSNLLFKIGIALIFIGLLILLLKEIIILILASIFIALGIFLITTSFRMR
ncbi:MAG: hypothetical protein CMG26_01775 [Candidatus Marinimicrobia bacterium]|nr:hypothetical protein [Candidatus Neomarinimicrobiota bacterium]MBV67066.1 hypothetical protein [Candidatus Neomarinimicrobiota bacterium]